MEDEQILDLYWTRSESAIAETDRKYGAYCRSIAGNILHDLQDTEECVNDTWLKAWNAMPPQRPGCLSAFLGRITRNLALDRCRIFRAEKRGGGTAALALDELGDCIPSRQTVEDAVDASELSRLIDRFLRTLSQRDCALFLRRYWYMDSTRELCGRFALTEGSVKSNLHRTRNKLREFLEKEGISL